MKFRYYITNMHEGDIEGTNSAEIAADLSMSEDYFVVDSETGEWLTAGGNRHPIDEVFVGD